LWTPDRNGTHARAKQYAQKKATLKAPIPLKEYPHTHKAKTRQRRQGKEMRGGSHE